MEIPHLLDGNVKQYSLPFNLNPNVQINKQSTDKELETAKPQIFSFRKYDYNQEEEEAIGILNFLPKSANEYFKNDISYRLTKYNYHNSLDDDDDFKPSKEQIFNRLPAIQIREFLPDQKLDQVISLINPLIKKIQDFFKQDNNISLTTTETTNQQTTSDGIELNSIQEWFDAIKYFMSNIIKYIGNTVNLNGEEYNFMSDLNLDININWTDMNDSIYSSNKILQYSLLKIPYLIYYSLQSTTTTNIYEIPFINEPKLLYSSNGTSGWNSESSGIVNNLLQKIPFVGTLMPNIGISWSPWWNSLTGQGTSDDEVQVTFDLFNDSADAALINFIFINTIIPNNRWMQYGIIQHSPCLYDIKIEGARRLYVCTGAFTVTYDGVLREPNDEFLCRLYSGKLSQLFTDDFYPFDLIDSAYKNKHIKIPDVYHVTMKFNSLLPQNFNQFLFQYVSNKNIREFNNGNAKYTIKADFNANLGTVTDNISKIWIDAKDNATKKREAN